MTVVPEARLALRARGLLAEHNRAGVLTAADVHVAQRLGRLGGESDEAVLLAVALLVRSTRQGSVVLQLADARQLAEPATEADAEIADPAALAALRWPEPAAWRDAVARSPLVATDDADGRRPLRLADGALWLDRYWRQEVAVAEDLLGRAAAVPAVDPDRVRAVLARLWPGDGPHDQRLAAAVAVLSRVAVVAGGPGTGKTTTVARLVVALRELAGPGSSLRLALAAPTGKAAARLQEALRAAAATDRVLADDERSWLDGLEASTVHRLLGVRRGTSRFGYDRDNPLPVDVLVVDEASMVSLTLVARLLEALPPSARLVLVGDPDQLAAVEAGAVLADLTAAARNGGRTAERLAVLQAVVPADVTEEAPSVPASTSARVADGIAFLRTVHRFGGGIARLAESIRAGDDEAVLAALRVGAGDVRFVEVDDDEPLTGGVLADLRAEALDAARAVLDAARAGDGSAAVAASDRYRLMCAHRRGPRGVAHWQRTVEGWVVEELGVQPGRDGRYPGQPLLVLGNDYDNHLYNGDTGVVLEEESGGLVAVFGQPTATLRVPLGRLGDVTALRALTVHRSQGGQFERVTVLLPGPASPLATRETIYTAVTRARQAVTVIGSEAGVRWAVRHPAARATGLGRRLGATTG